MGYYDNLVTIEHIVKLHERLQVFGRKFLEREDMNANPSSSSLIDQYLVSPISNSHQSFKSTSLKCKGIHLWFKIKKC